MNIKIINTFSFILLLLLAGIALSSCNRGYGCPINQSAHVEMGKDGKLPKNKGTSSLFPKDMGKKRKRKKRN